MKKIDNLLAYENSPKVVQDSDAFSFSIDSTVLSFFIDKIESKKRIIDLGCGNCSLPLFMSLLTSSNEIYGVEIQEKTYLRAKETVDINNLNDRIHLINDDIKNIRSHFKQAYFDLVLSNPPYFRLNDSKDKNIKEELLISRHEVMITMEDIIKEASYLLKDNGSFALVQRCDRFTEAIELLNKYRLFPKRIRFVYPKENKDAYIFLIECKKNTSAQGLKILEPLYIYNKDDYSEEILKYFHYGENDEKK